MPEARFSLLVRATKRGPDLVDGRGRKPVDNKWSTRLVAHRLKTDNEAVNGYQQSTSCRDGETTISVGEKLAFGWRVHL